jgi:GTP-binding protein
MGSLQLRNRMLRCVLSSRASLSHHHYQQQQQGQGQCEVGPVFGSLISRNLAQPAKWKQKAPRKKKYSDANPPPPLYRRQTQANPMSLNSKRKKSVHPEDYHSQPADSFAAVSSTANSNASASASDADSDADAAISLEGVNTHIPPALLLPTASRYAYVAQIAAQTSGIDPRQLFADVTDDPSEALPATFRHGAFHYMPPAAFNHELTHSTTPEVAFLGRSNVGKSSLVNALMRRSLARTSKQPGRTQQVQYYGWLPNVKNPDNGESMESKITPATATAFLVDLPGYGFAVAPHAAADAWQSVTQEWLVDRTQSGSLRRLYLLQDGRHGAQSIDLSVQTWLEENDVPYSIVYTKADQTNRPALVKWVNQACMRYHQQYMDMDMDMDTDSGETTLAMGPVVHVTSSKTGAGLAELWSAMEAEFATEKMQSQSQTQTAVHHSDFSDNENDHDHYGYDRDVESGDSDFDGELEHPYESSSDSDGDGDGEVDK